VLVAFGTHLAPEKARLVDALGRVAARVPDVAFDLSLGGTAVASGAHGGSEPAAARVRVVDYVDYDRLDRYDAVMHHGGTGIAQATLAAGRPAVVIPVDYDQPDVAARLVHHDLADRLDDGVLRAGAAGAERLAAAVRRALAPSAARRAALERFRDACERNDGAVGAADVIQQALTTSRPVAGSATGAPA
jgi:UDP:flavonoid glycosyltransferase YjiC (YdhE family)